MTNNEAIISHYDKLIDENNDPFRDPEPLREYMNKWDGDIFFDCLSLSAEDSVLEIGMGTGRLAARAALRCKELFGVDISPKTVLRAKDNLSGLCNVTVLCGDFLTFEFGRTFDVLYSSLTFMHIENKNKKEAFAKAYSLLCDGGRFVLSIDKSTERFINTGASIIEVFPDSPQDSEALFSTVGFTVERRAETEFAHIFVALKQTVK